METITGPENRNFPMGDPEVTEDFHCSIRGFDALFKLSLGSLVYRGIKYKDQVVRVDFSDSERFQLKWSPGWGFNSCLGDDYAAAANRLVENYCVLNDYVINHHFSSWPVFHALVTKKKKA